MEIKNPEGEDLVSTNNGDFGQESRFYTCTFCQRGFSNAQALGGHMNVHRRDRARLQESIQETLISTETTKVVDLNSVDEVEAQSSAKEQPRKKDDGVDFKKPISLCIEPSSSTIRSNKVSSLLSLSPTEVDLELRLGMDPHRGD